MEYFNAEDNSRYLSGPLHVSLDITTKCMAKCLHCYNRSASNLNKNELTDDELRKLITEISQIKPFSFCFCGGEPLLKKDLIIEMTKVLRSAGVANVSMVSNGWLMTQETVNALSEANISMVQISLDGAKPETHDYMRGLEGIHKRATDALKMLDRSGIPVSIAFSPTKFNISEFEDVIKFAMTLKNIREVRVQPLMLMGEALSNLEQILPDEDDYRYILKIVKKYSIGKMHECMLVTWGDPIDHLKRFTEIKFDNNPHISISAEGEILPSNYLPVSIGNIKKHCLADYWDAGIGKMWTIPVVRELAECVNSISDLGFSNSELPTTFFESHIKMDIIDDSVFANLSEFTMKTLINKEGAQNAK